METRDFSRLFKQPGKERKRARKQKRHLKKVVKKAYFEHKNIDEAVKSELEGKKKAKKTKKVKKSKKVKKTEPTTMQSEVERFQSDAKKAHIKRLQDEPDNDDKEIKYLMKKLGYNKRKNKTMPKIFEAEGLSSLWEIAEGKFSEQAGTDTKLENNQMIETEPLIERVDSSEQINDEQIEDETESEEDVQSCEESEGSESEIEDEEEEAELIEDIYGRTINSKTRKIVKGIDTSKAQQKLQQLDEEDFELTEEKRAVLTKSIRSIFNRLNESTLVAAVKNMQKILTSNSRNDVKQIFYEIFAKTITTQSALTDRLVVEFAGFLLLVHQLVSSEISAYFVEKFTLNYLDMLANEDQERNSLRNSTRLIANIYNFKVIRAAFLIELMDKLRLIESPISLTMLAELLTYSGITLKKRDGSSLSAFIARLHEQIENMPKEKLENDRIGFLIEDFLTLKNSKVARFTEKFDRSFLEHYEKVVKGLTKQIEKKESELGFSVDDILHVSERGRWWIVGSAFARNSVLEDESINDRGNGASLSNKFDENLLALASKLQMNTELRKEIFCTIMSSTSLMDAYEKLLKLGKSDHQGRELIYILVICALHERTYNPFYANLIERFCEYKRNFQLTTQFAIWDRIKQLSDLKKHQRLNLALLISDLIWLEAAQLTLLKVVDFGMLDDASSILLKRVMFRLLVKSSENALSQTFGRITRDKSKNELLAHGLQLFFEVMLKVEDFEESEELPIFKKRLDFVRTLLGIFE